MLLVPRRHRTDICDVRPEEAASIMVAAQRVAEVLRDDLGAIGVNLR
jgi:diadenosine tetraphosphate (Ap4A) HIT family hydrolase